MTDRSFAWAVLCVSIVLTSAISATPVAPQDVPSARASIDQYCAGCHNDKLKTGGLYLNLDISRPGEHPEVWEKVVRKLSGRMMPTPGRPRPDESRYDALVNFLEKSLD